MSHRQTNEMPSRLQRSVNKVLCLLNTEADVCVQHHFRLVEGSTSFRVLWRITVAGLLGNMRPPDQSKMQHLAAIVQRYRSTDVNG